MSGFKALGGSAILGTLLLVSATPAFAFDPPQRLQRDAEGAQADRVDDEDWTDEEDAGDQTPSDRDAQAAPSSDEDAAVDLCAVAAEREATIDGRRGRVSAIGDVRKTGGGWEVEGVVETGRGLIGLFRDETLFSCVVRNGKVESVRIEDESDAG